MTGPALLHLLTRHETIVALAVTGAILSILASVLSRRPAAGAAAARWCNRAGYAFMGASMLLFVVAGFGWAR